MKQNDQTGQANFQAIAKSNTNTTATEMASRRDHQYENVDT